jgi:hypothetical protein
MHSAWDGVGADFDEARAGSRRSPAAIELLDRSPHTQCHVTLTGPVRLRLDQPRLAAHHVPERRHRYRRTNKAAVEVDCASCRQEPGMTRP